MGATPARAFVLAALVASCLSLARGAAAARAPDVVKKTFSYHGDAARALAGLLELSPDRRVVDFELSQGAEHAALPDRDKALREPDGTLSPEIQWRTSTQIHETATWDPATSTLTLDGWVADMNTALPTPEGLAYSFSSPWFAEAEADTLPGWRPLLPKTAALPAKAMSEGTLLRKIDVALGAREHATLSLWRLQTWSAKNLPAQRSFLVVEIGAPTRGPGGVDAGGPGEPRSGARSCGCRVGAIGDPWCVALAPGAVVLAIRRRRRRGERATSRTRRPASPGRP